MRAPRGVRDLQAILTACLSADQDGHIREQTNISEELGSVLFNQFETVCQPRDLRAQRGDDTVADQ